MTFWTLLQVIVDILFFVGLGFAFIKLNRPAPEDPRMSKGLQLLQSKISVLEDLSDRTDHQVKQLTSLLEQKIIEIQKHIAQAETQISKIDSSIQKSMEVANIFQDKIPHDEILERQNTRKYVKAAMMAHKGANIEDIVAQVGLSKGEVEFIAKVNKDQLMFSAEDLPHWAKDNGEDEIIQSSNENTFVEPTIQKEIKIDLSKAFEMPEQDQESLKKLGEAFRQACEQAKKIDQQITTPIAMPKVESMSMSEVKTPPINVATTLKNQAADIFHVKMKNKNEEPIIRKVEFPRINLTKDILS